MTDITWTVNGRNSQHHVRALRTNFGSRQELWLDQQCIKSGRMFLDYPGQYFIDIDEEEYELAVTTRDLKTVYYLLHDGIPVPSDQDQEKGITAEALAQDQQLNLHLLRDLGQALNFSYWRHRLIGSVRGYLTVVQKGISSNKPYRVGWYVIVRHAHPVLDDTGKKIESDPRIGSIRGKKKFKDDFNHQPDFTKIFLPATKNETVAEIAARVQTFLAIVTSYTQPVAENVCENPECQQRFITSHQIVIVNDLPKFFCQDCIGGVSEIGAQTKKRYAATPDQLLPGFIIGVGIVLLGAMIWAAFALLLNMNAAVVSFGILIWIVREMDRVGTKRSGRSISLAFLLSIISITLGRITTIFFLFIRQGAPISVQTMLLAFNDVIFSEYSQLFTIYFFTLLLGFLPIWLQQKIQFSQAFKPSVEILPQKFYSHG